MPEWTPDPVVGRFRPDPELLARVQRHVMREWAESAPTFNNVRQQWENAFGAVRVAMDCLRDVWPTDREVVSPGAWDELERALDCIQAAYGALDRCRYEFESDAARGVALGNIRTHEELDAYGVPRDDN